MAALVPLMSDGAMAFRREQQPAYVIPTSARLIRLHIANVRSSSSSTSSSPSVGEAVGAGVRASKVGFSRDPPETLEQESESGGQFQRSTLTPKKSWRSSTPGTDFAVANLCTKKCG